MKSNVVSTDDLTLAVVSSYADIILTNTNHIFKRYHRGGYIHALPKRFILAYDGFLHHAMIHILRLMPWLYICFLIARSCRLRQ